MAITLAMQEYTDDQRTAGELIAVLEQAAERKTSEADALRKKAKRLKNPDRIAMTGDLIEFLEADSRGYRIVAAGLAGEPIDSVEDAEPPVDEDLYEEYVLSLDPEDLENERDAVEIRADLIDSVLQDTCTAIGKDVLGSKKMIKALLDDPVALEFIGEVVYSDEYLMDLYRTAVVSKKQDGDKGGKKKKKKKV